MNELLLTRRPADPSIRYRPALEKDYDRLVVESTRVSDEGGLKIVFLVLDDKVQDLQQAFRNIKYGRNERTGGLKTQSRVLGFQPRITIRRPYCKKTGMAEDHPKEHDTFIRWGQKASAIYKEYVGAAHDKQKALLEEKVLPCWRIPDSVFTSGIVNYNNVLNYHTDTGNFPGTWNAMYAYAFDCAGGNLVLPEYRLGFSFKKPAFIIFPARDVFHGVTPLRKRSKFSFRYSVVYYALQGMCQCLEPAAEIARVQKFKTNSELKRSGLMERPEREKRALERMVAKAMAAKKKA